VVAGEISGRWPSIENKPPACATGGGPTTVISYRRADMLGLVQARPASLWVVAGNSNRCGSSTAVLQERCKRALVVRGGLPVDCADLNPLNIIAYRETWSWIAAVPKAAARPGTHAITGGPIQ